MLYSTCSTQFKQFLLTKEKLLLNCFPKHTEQNLVTLIESFACSRTIEYFEQEFQKFEADVKASLFGWGNLGINATLQAHCIPLPLRLNLLRDMLNLKCLDKIEEWNLEQVLIDIIGL
jgi:hypothetical protein